MNISTIDTVSARLFFGGLIAIIFIGGGILSSIPASFWKQGILFGVSVGPNADTTTEGRSIISGWQRYIITSSVLLAIAALASAYWLPFSFVPLIAFVTPFLIIVVYIIGLQYFHNKAMGLALPESGTVRSAPVKVIATSRVPAWWEFGSLGIIIATAAYLATQYNSAPAEIPRRFGFDGTPNAYVMKSFGSYFMPVFVQIGIWLLLTVIGLLVNGVRNYDSDSSANFPGLVTRFLFSIKISVLVLLGSIQAVIDSANKDLFKYIVYLPMIFLVSLFIGLFFFARRYNQIVKSRPTTGDATADTYWWNGIVYRNPNDPSLFVERRIGIGYTLNFGHPAALGITLVVILLVIPIPIAAAIFGNK